MFAKATEEFKPKGEEDVKAEVIKDLGLDEETQKELITKITDERLEHQKTLGTAIRQKRDKAKALDEMEAGKDFYKGKAGLKPKKGNESNKTNTQDGLSRDEAILFSKGHTEEEVELAIKLSKVNKTSIIEATKDDYFTGVVDKRKQEEKDEKAKLSGSKGGGHNTDVDVTKMSKEEHRAHSDDVLKEAGLG